MESSLPNNLFLLPITTNNITIILRADLLLALPLRCGSSQGGAGGGGGGGHVHLSDSRAPPDYGRIAWPEDIFGSIEVDGQGNVVGENGNYQESGSYRLCTRDGM